MKPRVGRSPPELPTITLSFTTSGATVAACPSLKSSSVTSHSRPAVVPVERDQVRIERRHEQPVAERREPAVDDVGAAVGEPVGSWRR